MRDTKGVGIEMVCESKGVSGIVQGLHTRSNEGVFILY